MNTVFKNIIVLLTFLVLTISIQANELKPIFTSSVGMFILNVNENASGISTTDTTVTAQGDVLASTSISALSLQFNYEFKTFSNKSYFVKLVTPLVTDGGQGVFLGALGFNYFFGSIGSLLNIKGDNFDLTLMPTYRFYIGASVGPGYLLYNTDSKKKGDVFLNIGVHVGYSYNFSDKWSLMIEGGAGKGSGSLTSSIGFGGVLGASYFL